MPPLIRPVRLDVPAPRLVEVNKIYVITSYGLGGKILGYRPTKALAIRAIRDKYPDAVPAEDGWWDTHEGAVHIHVEDMGKPLGEGNG